MYKLVIKIVRPIIKFFLRVEVEGTVNIKDGEKFVVCANHLSNWDPILVVICTGIPINFLAKESLFKIPVLRDIIKAFGTIPINRNAPDTAPIRKAIEVINSGGCFSIFPQGQRLHVKPHPDQAKNGVALICSKANAGVLPVGIYTKNYKIALFRKIKVKIGDYIPFSDLNFGEGKPDYTGVTKHIFSEICDLVIPEDKND